MFKTFLTTNTFWWLIYQQLKIFFLHLSIYTPFEIGKTYYFGLFSFYKSYFLNNVHISSIFYGIQNILWLINSELKKIMPLELKRTFCLFPVLTYATHLSFVNILLLNSIFKNVQNYRSQDKYYLKVFRNNFYLYFKQIYKSVNEHLWIAHSFAEKYLKL